jgi:hypothetical protein
MAAKAPLQTCRKQPYANIPVFDSDNGFMFFASQPKAEWYLERELAAWQPTATMPDISPDAVNTPPTRWLKLLFKPKGEGRRHDSFYRHALANCCVVCGFTPAEPAEDDVEPTDDVPSKRPKLDTPDASGCGLPHHPCHVSISFPAVSQKP